MVWRFRANARAGCDAIGGRDDWEARRIKEIEGVRSSRFHRICKLHETRGPGGVCAPSGGRRGVCRILVSRLQRLKIPNAASVRQTSEVSLKWAEQEVTAVSESRKDRRE
jgi:hypothetical protein